MRNVLHSLRHLSTRSVVSVDRTVWEGLGGVTLPEGASYCRWSDDGVVCVLLLIQEVSSQPSFQQSYPCSTIMNIFPSRTISPNRLSLS